MSIRPKSQFNLDESELDAAENALKAILQAVGRGHGERDAVRVRATLELAKVYALRSPSAGSEDAAKGEK